MLNLPRTLPRRSTREVASEARVLDPAMVPAALWRDPAAAAACRTLAALLSALFRHYRFSAPVGMRHRGGPQVTYRLREGAELKPLSRLADALVRDMASAAQPSSILVSPDPGDAGKACLAIHLATEGPRLRLVGAYDPGVFDRDTVSDILRHLEVLLTALATSPDRELSKVDILTARERALLLGDWNGRPGDCLDVPTLDELFRTQATRTPDAPALVDGATVLTYGELDAVSDAAATRLLNQVADTPNPVVAVEGPRSWKTFALALAIVKAGRAFIYLDPAIPPSWRDYAYQIAEPAMVIRDGGGPGDRSAGKLAAPDDLLRAHRKVEPVKALSVPEAAAYVALTSGSTGRPKGVVRSHRLQVTRLVAEQQLYGFGGADVFLLKSPPAAREYFWPISVGACAVVAKQGGEIDADYLIDLMEERKITVATLVPSMVKVLLNARRSLAETSLRHIFCGGEILPREVEEKARALGIEIHNTYTLNEADMVCHRRGPGPAPQRGSVIGKPLDMRVYLCDENGRMVPPGAVGEIYTGGPGLASGYLGSDAPRDRFVDNVFDDSPARVLFRTGDLARFLDQQGNLEFLGRVDSQLKIRGHRVDPADVEKVIERSDLVEMVAVGNASDPHQGDLLVAYVVPASDEFDIAELRAELAGSVPSYLVPTYVVPMDRLPLLPNGKVDRAALMTQSRSRPELSTPYQPARGTEEMALADIWRRVLGLDRIGAHDDFFTLGGDSLRLMVIVAMVNSELHWRIRPSVIFEYPTIARMAERMRRDMTWHVPVTGQGVGI
jgi:amino acid adenylation domain-containing protein